MQNSLPLALPACLAWHDVKISWTASEHCICIYTILSACSCVSGSLLVHMHTLHKLAVWRRAAIFGIMNQYRRWIFLLISVVQLWILPIRSIWEPSGPPQEVAEPFPPRPWGSLMGAVAICVLVHIRCIYHTSAKFGLLTESLPCSQGKACGQSWIPVADCQVV